MTSIAAAPLGTAPRLLAGGLVAGAVGLGAAAGRSRAAAAIVGAWVASIGIGAAILAIEIARAPETTGDGDAQPLPDAPAPPVVLAAPVLTVLIAARDEADVLDGVLGDLARQAGGPSFDVIVIDDRSRDSTGSRVSAVAGALGLGDRVRVIRRDRGPDGKGAALAFATEELGAAGDRVIVVLDADARVGPAFLAHAVAVIAGGAPAATAQRRMPVPASSGRLGRVLARTQDGEQALDAAIQRARCRLGGGSELRGDGMVVRADVLAALGGWDPRALCEDLELSAHLFLATGRGVAVPRELEVVEQPAPGVCELSAQRRRWAEGAIRRDLCVSLPALSDRRIPVRRRTELTAVACQLLVPWLLLGLASGVRSRAQRRRLAIGLGTCATSAALLVAVAAPRGRPWTRGRVGESAALVAFLGHWLVVIPPAWLRVIVRGGSPLFARTRHEAWPAGWMAGSAEGSPGATASG